MKKNLFFTLSLLLSVVVVEAQVEVTTYRGAFAPSPTTMWTDGWTNWDPQNTSYGVPNVTVSGHITVNTTWTKNNVYNLNGLVYLDSTYTLTIEAGTIIQGNAVADNSSLIIRRGAKLIAEGAPCNPIVFTSSKAPGSRGKGDWGGIILLGKARHNLGTQVLIEGTSGGDLSNYHGGTNDNDNSGVLKYVRIEYGGFDFASNNEINSLTMGSVGRGTTIDYIQSSFNNDDAFEWFGGSVNCKHLVSYRNLDDDFDTDNGFSGTVQYGLIVRDPAISDNPAISTSEGFESDNDAGGANEGLVPKTSASFYNITQVGGFRCASNTAGTGVQPGATGYRRGLRLRRNTDLKIYNSIFMGNFDGLFIDGTLALNNTDQDSLVFRNNIIAGDFSSTWSAPYAANPSGGSKSTAAENAATRTRLFNVNYHNDSLNTCALLTNAWNFTAPDYRPNVAGDGVILNSNLTAAANLTPIIVMDNNLFTPSQSIDMVVTVQEINAGATAGVITVTIAKPSGWNVLVPGLALTASNQAGTNGTSDVDGGTPNNNGGWVFRDNGTSVIATSTGGTLISKGGSAILGFTLTRKAATTAGTNQNIGATIAGGNDITPANNGTSFLLSASN